MEPFIPPPQGEAQALLSDERSYLKIDVTKNVVISSRKFFKEARYRYVVPIFYLLNHLG